MGEDFGLTRFGLAKLKCGQNRWSTFLTKTHAKRSWTTATQRHSKAVVCPCACVCVCTVLVTRVESF